MSLIHWFHPDYDFGLKHNFVLKKSVLKKGQIFWPLFSGQIFRPDFGPQDEIIRPGMTFRPPDVLAMDYWLLVLSSSSSLILWMFCDGDCTWLVLVHLRFYKERISSWKKSFSSPQSTTMEHDDLAEIYFLLNNRYENIDFLKKSFLFLDILAI